MEGKKVYVYPEYMPENYMVKGITYFEASIIVIQFIILMLCFRVTGILIGILTSFILYWLMNRLGDGRSNLLIIFYNTIRYMIRKLKYPAYLCNERKIETYEGK